MRFLPTLTLTLGLFAGTATAQDFNGVVTNDPVTGLATYDFHFQGPPAGRVVLLGSVGLSPVPLPLGPWGNLYLDPLTLMQVGPVLTLDAGGQASMVFSVPQHRTAAASFTFQPIFVENNNLRLLGKWNTLIQGGTVFWPPISDGYAFSYDMPPGPGAPVQVHIVFYGEHGDEMRMVIKRGGQNIAVVQRTIQHNCFSDNPLTNVLNPAKAGDTWHVERRKQNSTTWEPVASGTF